LYQVDYQTKAFTEDELIQKLPQYQAVGIRSKTKITAKVIDACPKVCPTLGQSLPVLY
jgi:D-3-phosphoglycerate dehydrogenase